MDKRSVVFTHSYSRMSKKSIIRMESEDPSVKNYLSKLSGVNVEVTNEDKFFKLFINSLRKLNRNFNDNQIIVKYIQGMNEFSEMLKVYMHNYMDLVHIISQTMKYELHQEKHILFKQGEKGEQFFVILQGSVDILVAKDLKMVMTEEEYVHYLEKLDFYEEYHLVNNCVTANRSVFPFDIKQANGSKSVKKQFISRRSVVFKDFMSILSELDRDKIHSIDYQGYIDRIKPIHNKEKVTKDSRLIEVRVWQYYHVLNMKTGGYFGDAALLSIDQKRTATIITSEDTHFGVIGKFTFDTCIKEANEKKKNINLNIILNNQIFSEFSKKYFKKFYYNFFVTVNFSLYDKVITKGTPESDIYIVKSGDFEISMKRSLVEIGECIKELGGTLKNSEIIRETMNDSPAFRKFMNEKLRYRISIVRISEIVGMSDMIINGKNFFNVECISSKGEMLKIERNLLNLIVNEEKYLNSIIQGFLNKKRNYLIERLLNIRETRLNHFDNTEKESKASPDKVISDLIHPVTKKQKKQFSNLRKKDIPLNVNFFNSIKESSSTTTKSKETSNTINTTKDNQECTLLNTISSISRKISNETTINSTINELVHIQNKFNLLKNKTMTLISKKEKLEKEPIRNNDLITPNLNKNQMNSIEVNEVDMEYDNKKFNLRNLTLDKKGLNSGVHTPSLSPFKSKDTTLISPSKKCLFEVLPHFQTINTTKLSPKLKFSDSSKENSFKLKNTNKLDTANSNYYFTSVKSYIIPSSSNGRNINKNGLYKEFIKISDEVQNSRKSFKKQLFNKIVNEYCTPKNEEIYTQNSIEKLSENRPSFIDCLSFDNLKRIYTNTLNGECEKAKTIVSSKEKKNNKYRPFVSNFTLKKMVQKNNINESNTNSNQRVLESLKITGISKKSEKE